MEVDGEKEREECEEEEEEEEEEEWEQVGPKNKSTITRQVCRRNDLNLPFHSTLGILLPFPCVCSYIHIDEDSLVHCTIDDCACVHMNRSAPFTLVSCPYQTHV